MLTRPNRGTRYSLLVMPGSMRNGTHRVTAITTFTKASGTKPRTMRVAFQRCSRIVHAPAFTG
jgi:hypothetical protein